MTEEKKMKNETKTNMEQRNNEQTKINKTAQEVHCQQ